MGDGAGQEGLSRWSSRYRRWGRFGSSRGLEGRGHRQDVAPGCILVGRSLARLGHGEMKMHLTLPVTKGAPCGVLEPPRFFPATLGPPSLSPLAPSWGLWAVRPSQGPSTHMSRAPKVGKDPRDHQVQPLHFTNGETEAKRELSWLRGSSVVFQRVVEAGSDPLGAAPSPSAPPPVPSGIPMEPPLNPQWVLVTTPRFSSHLPHHHVGRKCSPQMPTSPSWEIFVFFIANKHVSSTASISNHGKVCFLTGVGASGRSGGPFNQPPL